MWRASEKNFLILSQMEPKNIHLLEKDFDIKNFMLLSLFHKTGGIIYNNVKKIDFISDEIKEYLKNDYLQNSVRNSIFLEFANKIINKFPLIPFKGVAFLEKIYQNQFGLRFMSDIDLILNNIDIKEVLDYLYKDFHFNKIPNKILQKTQKIRSHIMIRGKYKNIPIQLELHWRPFEIPIPIDEKDLHNPFLISTIHSIFHYYFYRIYHFVEWQYLFNYYYDDKRIKELGFESNLKYLNKLSKAMEKLDILPYPFKNFIKKPHKISFLERFYFWFFIEKKLKTNGSYFKFFIKRVFYG